MSLSEIQLAVQELFDRFGLDIPVDVRVKELSIARQQIVEIMRSVSQQAKLILMDEPTSSLTDVEIQFFTRLIRDLKDSGVGILFTSHKMEEIFGFTDVMTVLRDGEVVGTYRSNAIDAQSLVQKMVGRELKDFYPKADVNTGDMLLEVENLGLSGVFDGINFIENIENKNNIDNDLFKGKENKTKLVEKLLHIWKADPIHNLKILLKKIL